MSKTISAEIVNITITQLNKAIENKDWSIVYEVISDLEKNTQIITNKNLSQMIHDIAKENIDNRAQ